MYWWQTPFSSSVSSSSSSSSSSFKHNQSDGSALRKVFSFRGQFFGSRHRRLSRKFRHLSDGGVDREPPPMWKSPSRQDQSSVVPQPLPLPELTILLPRDAASSLNPRLSLVSVPLPSPKERPSRGGVERERPNGFTGDANGQGVTASSAFDGMIACSGSRKSKDHTDTRHSRKILQELDGVEVFEEKYGTKRTVSAPTSPLSSPTLSPRRISGDIFTSYYGSPQVFQHWCAPEMPPPDMNLGRRLCRQTSSDKTAFSVESSPLHSSRTSPSCSTGSPCGPTSPLHRKLSFDTPKGRLDSNAHANVHPLPRPPGSTMPAHSTPQVTAKPDLMPIKSQWQKGKLIGRGSFGSVYVASSRETGALCAMKEVELFLDDPKSAESIKQLEQEIKLLSQLKHPNIVQYYGSEIIEGRFNIYLEYVHPGSINKYILDHCGAITESVVRNFTRHILSGLAYLHSTKTVHRDIKGANLLVDVNGVVKLADFGMAKHLAGPATILSLKGSPYWMAPELLQSMMQKDTSSDLALAVDIWSLGCTIIEMLNGKPPWSEYEGAAALFKVLREIPPIPETLSPEGKDFLRCCFRRNPADRPSAKTLLEHRFLKNSHQLDVPTFTRALDGMKLMEKVQSSREWPACKLESLLSSPIPRTKGKLTNIEVDQQSGHETSNLKVVPRHSPSSTLEALPSLSPPHSGQSKLPSPSANARSSIAEGAKKNHYS